MGTWNSQVPSTSTSAAGVCAALASAAEIPAGALRELREETGISADLCDVVGLVGEPHADVANALLALVDSERQRTRWPLETVLRHAFGQVLLRLMGRPGVFEKEARDIVASVEGRHPSHVVGTVAAQR